jgi:hypothetical protein
MKILVAVGLAVALAISIYVIYDFVVVQLNYMESEKEINEIISRQTPEDQETMRKMLGK